MIVSPRWNVADGNSAGDSCFVFFPHLDRQPKPVQAASRNWRPVSADFLFDTRTQVGGAARPRENKNDTSVTNAEGLLTKHFYSIRQCIP
jgi:hypothetical protein